MRIDSSGNLGIGTASPGYKLDVQGTAGFAGQITSTIGTNAIALNNSTSNWILWSANGIAPPSFTTRSNGTKVVLYPNISGSTTDYALGIDGGMLWSSVPSSADGFRWYSGTTIVAELNGNGNFRFNSGYGSSAVAYGCRAWVNFNGTGTPAIRASGNVSSITDNGTGDYTVNFTTALVDANYAVSGTAMNSLASANLFFSPATTAPSTTALRLITLSTGFSFQDSLYVSVAIFR